MGDKIKIDAKGDVAFGKDKANVTINKTANDSIIPDNLKTQLEALSNAVESMIKDMQADKAEEVKRDLETLTIEATSNSPRRKWYELSGEGLIEAAKAIGVAGKPVITTTQSILKLLAP